MNKIKFGTDGWRAIIADDYTVDNVRRVAEATADWLFTLSDEPNLLIGNDCRFGGKLFVQTAACVLAEKGVKVVIASNPFVSTPMISLGANKLQTTAAVIITASHNPPTYNGYKLKANFGGPALPEMIDAVESNIPEKPTIEIKPFDFYEKAGMFSYVDLEDMYVAEIEKSFDLEAIKNSGFNLAFDAMYGSGQNVIKRILPEATMLHCEHNPSFNGQAPEPIAKNLIELATLIKNDENIKLGLAIDGDADRIGLFDENGVFVDSHNIILLLINYLHKNKKLGGKVAVSFSCTSKIGKLARHYNLPVEITKIGFKYICGIMVDEDVLVGGEESGGIAIKGFIPERDGIWIGLTLFEYMAKTGKNLNQLLDEVYSITGTFSVERNDLHLEEEKKQEIIANCKSQAYKQFGEYQIEGSEDLDGFKYHLGNEQWVMIRPSGTEPVLRIYAEAANQTEAFKILDATVKTITA